MKLNDVAAAAALGVAATLGIACKPTAQADAGISTVTQAAPSRTRAPSDHVPEEKAMNQLDSRYKESMSYNAFRKMLIADDWRPAADLDKCLTLSVGDNYKDRCANKSKMCSICNEFREIGACTDDGYCYITFSKNRDELNIKVYGDILRIKEGESEPIVEEWDITARQRQNDGVREEQR